LTQKKRAEENQKPSASFYLKMGLASHLFGNEPENTVKILARNNIQEALSEEEPKWIAKVFRELQEALGTNEQLEKIIQNSAVQKALKSHPGETTKEKEESESGQEAEASQA
jgi:phosphoenolpyruvate carboxylase